MPVEMPDTKLKHTPCVLCLIENPDSGKMDFGETIHQALVRETREETGLTIKKAKCMGRIDIIPDGLQDHPDRFSTREDVHVYLFYSKDYTGELTPAQNEVELNWFDKDKIPFEQMRDNDAFWIPEVLEGNKIHKSFFRGVDGKLKEIEHDDEDVDSLLEMRFRHYQYMSMLNSK